MTPPPDAPPPRRLRGIIPAGQRATAPISSEEKAMALDSSPAFEHESFETAAAHACTRVPVASPDQRVDDLRRGLIGVRYESASHVVVCEGRRFLGIARIEDVLAAPSGARIGDVVDRDAPRVAPGADQEVAAWHAVRNQEAALAVVDAEERFVGLIPPDRLLSVLLSEHEEDLSRLGGVLKTTSAARESSEEPVERRFRHRLPWLLVGLLGALLAADFVGLFEEQLQDELMLAFFVPGIVYLADAVGTQTETVVVRGLSVGVRMSRMVRRELFAGLAIGIALAVIAGPLIWLRWGHADLALCVALSLAAACSTATLAAMSLPWLLDLAGIDPAFGSGPLATVIQDLASILIYFGVAAAVMG
jgi:magnesium transporter